MENLSCWESPLGWLHVKDDGLAINEIAFAESRRENSRSTELGRFMIEELSSYFSGDLNNFTIPLNPKGSAFQLRVWDALQQIPL